jgi:hypothetical protein
VRRALMVVAFTLLTAALAEAQVSFCGDGGCSRTRVHCSIVGVTCSDQTAYCDHCSCSSSTWRSNCCLGTSNCCNPAADLYNGSTEFCDRPKTTSSTSPQPADSAKAAPEAAQAEAKRADPEDQ